MSNAITQNAQRALGYHAVLPVCAMVLACAGCGGGGGDGSPSASAPTAGDALGSRDLPGHVVSVSVVSLPVVGTEATFVVQVEPPPQAVSVWLGQTYAEGASQIPVIRGDDGLYRIRLMIPAGAQQGLYVRLVDGEGNIIESGSDDFRLH